MAERGETSLAEEAGRSREDEDVIIRVCDESRGVTKNFTCKRSLLVSRMRYFRNYLTNHSAYDIDISVHCDVLIFEWLIRYIHQPDQPPPLDSSSVVSLLISSEFLEMDELIDLCLQYMSGHMNEILRIPLDFTCLSEKVIQKLACLCGPEILSSIKDRKDRVLSKLYRRRLEMDFGDSQSMAEGSPAAPPSAVVKGKGTTAMASRKRPAAASNRTLVHCCEHCGSLFAEEGRGRLPCPKAGEVVDFRGRTHTHHSPIPGWSLPEYTAVLRERGLSWQDLYWLVWGRTHSVRCRRCSAYFAFGELDQCRSHEEEPMFLEGSFAGHYPCCGTQVHRFNLYRLPPGCVVRDHVPDQTKTTDFVRGMLQNRRHWVTALAWREVLQEEACKIVAAAQEAAALADGESSDEDESLNSKTRNNSSSNNTGSQQPSASSTSRRPGPAPPSRESSGLSSALLRQRRRGASGSNTSSRASTPTITGNGESDDEGTGQPAGVGGRSRPHTAKVKGRGASTLAGAAGAGNKQRGRASTAGSGAGRSSSVPRSSLSSGAVGLGGGGGSEAASSSTAKQQRSPRAAAKASRDNDGSSNGFAIFRAVPIDLDGKPTVRLEEVAPNGHMLQNVPSHCNTILDGIRDSKTSAAYRREWLMDAQRDQDAHRMRLLSRRLMNVRTSPLEKENAGATTEAPPRESRGRKADRDRGPSASGAGRADSGGSSGPSNRRTRTAGGAGTSGRWGR